jgi:glycosyltransferase involved in cell wall biosynthesis
MKHALFYNAQTSVLKRLAIMHHPIIDITFLTNELKRKRPPHGLPRVILAYVEHYKDSMHLLYRVRRHVFVLPKPVSKQIGELLLQWDFNSYRSIMFLIMKGILRSKGVINPKELYFLFKLDQNGMKYPSYFKAIKRMGLQLLIVIHDLFPIDFPEYSDARYSIQFRHNIRSSVEHAQGLICVSESTHHSLIRFIQTLNVITPPLVVARLASGLSTQLVATDCPIKGAYFVIISTIVARKNHLLLLQLWRKLVEKMGENAPKLVVIGKRSSECTSTLAMLERCETIKEFIIEKQVSDQELANYLIHARALLFPTFAEGYGLPLIEALSHKVPVIASNLPIFHEIVGDIPDYADPLDGLGWMSLIKDYMKTDSSKRQAQLSRLDSFQMPTWEEHFAKISQLMNVLDQRSQAMPQSMVENHSCSEQG